MKPECLIEGYDLEVFTPPCSPGTVRFSAHVCLAVDLGAVLPYLNAVLPQARYNRAAPALSWQKDTHEIVFHPHQIAVGNLIDRAEAEHVVQTVVDLVNQTWAKRAEIEPDYTAPQRLAPMKVYQLLPQTNCRVCGQPTCFTFTLKLIAGETSLAACHPLLEVEFADKNDQLQTMLATAP
jgi:ArsR family metal-binding transcriptional regulator